MIQCTFAVGCFWYPAWIRGVLAIELIFKGDQVWVNITKSHLIFWPSSLYPPSQVQWGLLMLKSQLFHGEIRFDANNTMFDRSHMNLCLWWPKEWSLPLVLTIFCSKRCCRSLRDIAPYFRTLWSTSSSSISKMKEVGLAPFMVPGSSAPTARQTQTGQPCPGVGKGSWLRGQDSPFDGPFSADCWV